MTEWTDNIVQEAEHGTKHGQMKGVYHVTRKLCSEKIDMVRKNSDKLLTKVEEV